MIKKNIEETTNAKVLISDTPVIEICRDKINTQRFLIENYFGIPKVYSKNELNVYRSIIDNPIVQDFVEGEEYTVDVFL